MGELGVAQTLWLLGQDDQWLRPRVSAMPVAVAAGALLDVIDAGAARWVGDEDASSVEPTPVHVAEGLVGRWAALLRQAATYGPLPVIHGINAVSPHIWDVVGADLTARGCAHDVPRPVRRWLPPRRRPDHDAAVLARTHLRAVITGTRPASPCDQGVLAVASCAGVVEHVLSATAFTDHGALAPTAAFLEGSVLVRRLTPAVSYLVTLGPTFGSPPGGLPGVGSGS